MTELHDLIRARLHEGPWRSVCEEYGAAEDGRSAILAVLDKHCEYGVYDICGHQHEDTDPGVRDVEDVGLVCDDGYLYPVCFHGCAWDYAQTEACASTRGSGACFPCPTVRVIAQELGLVAAVET